MAVEESQAAVPAQGAGRIAASTLVVMGGFALSIVIGLIRQRVIAEYYGTSAELDAYFAANGIPELLFNALAGGALTFAFIPVYTKCLEQKDRKKANLLFSQVANVVLIITGVICFIAALAAPVLVKGRFGIGVGFEPHIQDLTVALMRILLISTVIFAVSNILTGALHANRNFWLPALTPLLYSAGIIFGAAVLSKPLGIYGLAWGAVLGAALHLLVQVPGLIYFKLKWLPNLYVNNPALVRVAILMAPRMLDLLMARIVIDVFNRSLASTLGPGRVSALEYASGLMRMPWTLIGTAIGITIFPTMAALAAEKDVQAQRGALSGSLRAILTLAIPAAVGLVILGRPLIKVLLEGGEFTSESTDIAYAALQFLSVALISQSVLEVVVRSFAAQEDTWTPLLVSFFTTALNVGLAYLFVAPLGISGLPLANGIAVGVEAITGIIILRRRWGGVDARRILVHTGKVVIAAGAMAASLLGLRSVVAAPPLVILVTGGGLGAVTYFGVALLLGLEEIRTVPLALLRHIIPARRRGEASV